MSNYFFSVILLSYSFPFARMRIHAFFPLPRKSFFRASVYLFSFFCPFFISRWNSTKEHRYVKRSSTLFGALFRRRFSSRLYPILLLSPPSFPFRFYYIIPSRLFHTHCLFLSWRSPLIQSRLNYAGFSSGDSTRKRVEEKKQNQNRGSVFRPADTAH